MAKVSKVVKINGDVIMDISQDNVNANNLLQGGTAHGSDGEAVQGAVIVAPTDVTEVSDTTPYIYKISEHDAVYDELVGGSVAWNQLVANSGSSLSVTITSGHKYVMKKSGTLSVGASSGSAITGFTGGTDWITDLTLMFGTIIADYVYNLEQSTAGSGIAWLKSYGFITKEYYPYNAGGLISVNVSGKKVVGKNQFFGSIENGVIYRDGIEVSDTPTRCKSMSYVPVRPNTTYTFSLFNNISGVMAFYAIFYNFNKECLGIVEGYPLSSFTTPQNAAYVRFDFYNNNNNLTPADVGDVQLELGSTATNYEPYTSLTYPIQSTDLRGLYKLDANNKLYTDGDIYSADGQITRKYGYRDYQSGDESLANAITDGTHTIYKLSAPTTETAPPFTSPQMVYRSGTEEYLDTRDVPMPVGGNRKYVDIPEWMVNEYFDDVRAEASIALPTTGGTINGDLDVNGLLDVHNAYVRDDLTVGKNLTVNRDLTVNPDHSINCRYISRTAAGRAAEISLETAPAIDFYVSDSGVSSQLHFSAGYFGINDATMIYSDAPSGTGTSLALDSSYNIVKVTSSRDTKHDISYVEDTNSYHDALMQLKPATFIYNSDKTETQKLGMIAEDVADVCPIAGMTDKDGKVENYDDRAIIAMLVAEVQRLNAEIEKLKGR